MSSWNFQTHIEMEVSVSDFSNRKLALMVREINWAKNIIIVEKCKDYLEREFYINYRNRSKLQPLVGEIVSSSDI